MTTNKQSTVHLNSFITFFESPCSQTDIHANQFDCIETSLVGSEKEAVKGNFQLCSVFHPRLPSVKTTVIIICVSAAVALNYLRRSQVF